MEHDCLDACHLLDHTIRAFDRRLGVVEKLDGAVVTARGKDGKGGVKIQRQDSLWDRNLFSSNS